MVKIRVAALTKAHVEWWDGHVQPLIDADPARPDAGWDWPKIRLKCSLSALVGQAPVGYMIGVERPASDELVPIAFTQIVRKYVHLADHRKKAVFLWYLSTAPLKELAKEGILATDEVPKRNGVAGLDVAVTESFGIGWEGRVGTHAAPKGRASLFKWYVDQGMTPLDIVARLPRMRNWGVFGGGNDGRYLYYDEAGAATFRTTLNVWRQRGPEAT